MMIRFFRLNIDKPYKNVLLNNNKVDLNGLKSATLFKISILF